MSRHLTADDWCGGCYLPARCVPSPNFNDRPLRAQVDLIVVHSISLPPGVFGGPQIEQLFMNSLDWSEHPYFSEIKGLEVSAHFLIRRDGEIVQFVDCDKRAWHAGVSMYRGRQARNDDSIGIELEGLEGGRFTIDQYQRLTVLCKAIACKYPIEDIAGHEHIAPGRKHDPGSGFDWRLLQEMLTWPSEMFPT